MPVIFENRDIKIEIEPSELPWFKIFTQYPYKEMCEVPKEIKIQGSRLEQRV